jgi:hypothetical protein
VLVAGEVVVGAVAVAVVGEVEVVVGSARRIVSVALGVPPVIDAARAAAETVPVPRVVVAVVAVVGLRITAALVVGRIGERRITAATCSA